MPRIGQRTSLARLCIINQGNAMRRREFLATAAAAAASSALGSRGLAAHHHGEGGSGHSTYASPSEAMQSEREKSPLSRRPTPPRRSRSPTFWRSSTSIRLRQLIRR